MISDKDLTGLLGGVLVSLLIIGAGLLLLKKAKKDVQQNGYDRRDFIEEVVSLFGGPFGAGISRPIIGSIAMIIVGIGLLIITLVAVFKH